jgi:3D-(3,5/4)-trihydroxycyclohexane-1,2-dione acylhydrolase (decyclizing)
MGIQDRAVAIRTAGNLEKALNSGAISSSQSASVSEAVVLGLLAQGVSKFFVVLGHGTTDLGEALHTYQDAGLVSVTPFRNEVEATHAASALRWVTGEPVVVVTSIGPGAMQAAAASLVASSDGLGVWFIFGDETTHDEGDNMQQIPGNGQAAYFRMLSVLGSTYLLHTPEALTSALRRGAITTNHPSRQQPFFLLLPINVQPKIIENLDLHRLPTAAEIAIGPANLDLINRTALSLVNSERVAIKVGRGAAGCGAELLELAELIDAVMVMSPSSLGVVPSSHKRQMGIGGSKGTISGNYAMVNARTLLVAGSRAVCQSDCSRTGYPEVRSVVNFNSDATDAQHYNNTIALIGDLKQTLVELIKAIRLLKASSPSSQGDIESEWLLQCTGMKNFWLARRTEIFSRQTLSDDVWKREVLTQPFAISETLDWVRANGFKAFFDAGDVQANGFQLADVDSEGWYFSESGASYMGFASSAVIAGGLANEKFYGVALTGDGSFMMNPQVLIDAVHTNTQGCIVIFDNRRMGAISSLQIDQYGSDFATSDMVAVDYVAMANSFEGVRGIFGGYSQADLQAALNAATEFEGLSVVHVPIYFGSDSDGGMGSYGRWNVGPWVTETEELIAKVRI